MGTNRISSTIISWYLSICGYGLEHPLFIQWGWLAQGHAFGLLRWRPGFDSREDVLAVSVPMYEPVCGSLGTGWEFYHLGPHWLVLNPQPTNQPLFISVFHSKDIQGDHLGMYLKQTHGSNKYWQTVKLYTLFKHPRWVILSVTEKRFYILKGCLTELDQSGTPLCELTRLGSTLDVFGYSSQVNPCFWRKAHIVIYSCAMLLTCISCVLGNWEIKALRPSMKKAGLQEDHGPVRGSKADVTL